MSNYCYEAVDAGGLKIQGSIDVTDQSEALRRIKEMGLFPTRIAESRQRRKLKIPVPPKSFSGTKAFNISISVPLLSGRVKPRALAVFTRQLATLIDAGMPLLRGLRTLQEQAEHRTLERIIGDLAVSIEGGSSLSEAMSAHPKVFNQLFVSMVKAGEMSGALEVTLRRLAEFLEKSQKIKGKIKAAMWYPSAVLVLAACILVGMTVFVIPRFRQVFDGLLDGARMPAFTLFVLNVSQMVKSHFVLAACVAIGCGLAFMGLLRTVWGRRAFDHFKLVAPIVGPVFRKAAISRFARTLGTLLDSGVPILPALTIVKETAGNVVVGSVIANVHDCVKEGENIAVPLKASRVFPSMVAGMVDVGEQTGALPDLLMKVADGYDEEVDNAINAMTSLIEPIMLVFLALIVGSIVIALFWPIIQIIGGLTGEGPGQ
jgi:type IV pilus assembly protein PilC